MENSGNQTAAFFNSRFNAGRDRVPVRRLARARSALRVLLEEFDGVAHRQDGLGSIIGNLAAELLLERHDQLDRIEAVGAEVVDEARVLGHLVRFDSQMLHNDLFHPLANVTHRCNLVSFELGSIGQRPRAIFPEPYGVDEFRPSDFKVASGPPCRDGPVMPPQPNRGSVTILHMA